MKNKQHKQGRPAREIKPIKDTPERVAQSIMKAPPKTGWNYLKNRTKQR